MASRPPVADGDTAASPWARETCALCSGGSSASPAPAAPLPATPDASPPRDALYTLHFRPSAPLRIFLSYGHDCFQQLAFHIKAALQARGHDVWVDVERLSAGVDWEDGITGALTWVKDAQYDGRVLLLMTPHALRRPDGYCLNEIARAASSRLSIFPVMVAESEPPPAIAILPFFDLRDCVPSHLALDANSEAWHEEMVAKIHSEKCWGKLLRLFALLELFPDMSAYGVPAVGGLENLGLFASYDPKVDQHPHLLGESARAGSSTRRLLLHRASRESIGLASTITSAALTAGERKLIRGASAPDKLPSSSSSMPSSPTTAGHPHPNHTDTGDLVDDPGQARSSWIGNTANTSVAATEPTSPACDGHHCRYVFSFDESCYVLAKQLFDDLSAADFHVFPPRRPLSLAVQDPDDGSSQNSFADALQWAAADKGSKLILLVTPESVGRPNGSSLNDISAAMAAGLGFVPLMVRPSEIPLSICRIQWLDMTDCLVYNGNRGATINAVRYQLRREQLVSALQRGQLDHEGQQARLFSLLSPFSFQQQISKLTHRFTGREWLFDMVRDWVDDKGTEVDADASGKEGAAEQLSARRVFWITGQIGAGKTAIAARMVQRFPEIAAFHFALQEHEQTQSARRCVLSLAYQLTTQLPEYAAYLQQTRDPLEEVVPVSSFPSLVTHLLVEPLNAIARRNGDSSSTPLVLLIDGLECILPVSSASMSSFPTPASLNSSSTLDGCLVSMLPSLVSRLPSWVRFVLLSRDTPDVRARLQAFVPRVTIDHFPQENARDIEAFIESSLGDGSAGDGDSAARNEDEETTFPSDNNENASRISADQIALIARRAEGLFLYAVNVVHAVEEGRLELHELDALPTGMGGSLRQAFDRHFAAQSDDERQREHMFKTRLRPVLEVLCAAYEPFTVRALASVLEWDSYERREVVASFGSLVYLAKHEEEADNQVNSGEDTGGDGADEEDCVLRPFHSSVLEWVQDARGAGPYFVDVANGHDRLGKWAAREYEARVRAKPNTFVSLNYALEGAARVSSDDRMLVYIVRHACNHLMQAPSVECMQLLGNFASDEQFQLARRLLSLRSEGLASFFHGDIDRDRAQQLLIQHQQSLDVKWGSFLIRYSARQRCYCASFIARVDARTGQPVFQHNLIYHLENGAYSAVPAAQVTESTIVYPDLVSFVEYYQRKGILRVAVPRQSALNREISEAVADTDGELAN